MEKNRNENNRKNPLNKSFGYAFEGIRTGIRKERNMKIHCLAVIAVTAAGTFLHIKPVEWCICLLLFGLIPVAGACEYGVGSGGRSCD